MNTPRIMISSRFDRPAIVRRSMTRQLLAFRARQYGARGRRWWSSTPSSPR
jgi:hypothetical protein